ncbi:MAG: hypothetical protein WDN00_15250 [Limisphaerales bacterium]
MIALEPLMETGSGQGIKIVRQIEHIGLDQNLFAFGVFFLELELFTPP